MLVLPVYFHMAVPCTRVNDGKKNKKKTLFPLEIRDKEKIHNFRLCASK